LPCAAVERRPFTQSSASLNGGPMNHPRLTTAFGSTRERYPGHMAHSGAITARSSTALSMSSSSTYLRSRGLQHGSPLSARSSQRERGGAAGNHLMTPALQRRIAPGGTPMQGVTSFPFNKQQSAYIEEFAPSVAMSLVHPFQAITENNADSTSFNIITGSAYQGGAPLSSEYKRQFKYGAGSFNAQGKRKPFGSDNPGLRSEEMITVGQYTPVLRSF